MKNFSITAAFLLGLFSVTAQPQPGTVQWSIDISSILTSPAVANDGTIYLSTGEGLLALADHGSSVSTNWFFPATAGNSGAAVGFDGTIYYPAGTNLFAVNPDGSQKWVVPLSEYTLGIPALGFDNTIYLLTTESLWSVSPFGNINWTRVIAPQWGSGWGEYPGPSVGADNTIYVTTGWGLLAFDRDGGEKWTYLGRTSDTPAIGADGTIYVSGSGLNAIRPDGTLRWRNPFDAVNSPVIGADGTIYVGNRFRTGLSAVSSQGELIWDILPIPTWHTPPPNTPAITSAGTIYNAVSNALFAVDPAGGVLWSFQSVGGYVGSPYIFQSTVVAPTISPNGTIYVQISYHLFAIAGTNGPGDTPWPLYHANARHTGKNEKPCLLKPSRRRDGTFEFQLYAQVGQSLTVQASTNLRNWSVVTNFVCSSVPTVVSDSEAALFASRFYRVVSP